ncbi:MAG: RNA methyltransferase [Nitratireductor sp.]|nr:RNA methyltransferase [Nitratireductor sp.]
MTGAGNSPRRPNHRAGQVKDITSTSNPLIKRIRGLALKKNRDGEQVFMAEGLKLLTDALETGWEIETVICSREIAREPKFAAIAAQCRARGADILEVSNKVLSAISRRDNPQMVIGVYRQRFADTPTLLGSLTKPGDVVVALDRVRDPGNLGTIIRTADCAGAKGILLIGDTTDPYSLEATRATMGSIFHMPIARIGEKDFLHLNRSDIRLAGTHLEGAVDYRTLAWSRSPAIVLMGNEQQGLTPALAAACDDLVLIPMAGQADSLNLAIATGIVLFEARRDKLLLGATIKGEAGP